jgi:hypothetical protein
MPSYNIFWSNGRALKVPAVKAVLAGHWRERELVTPSLPDTRAALPYRWRKAFDRAGSFWFDARDQAAPATMTLRNRRGGYLATLYAHPDRAYIAPVDPALTVC